MLELLRVLIYLCKVRDVATGIVLAHTMAGNMKAELVTATIKKAKRRWSLPEGYIHHSDLGSQYTAKETQALLKQLQFQQSFSRAGKPGDNAWSESFFSILKKKQFTGGISKHGKKSTKQYSHILRVFITRAGYKNA